MAFNQAFPKGNTEVDALRYRNIIVDLFEDKSKVDAPKRLLDTKIARRTERSLNGLGF